MKGTGGRVFWGDKTEKLFTAVTRNRGMNRNHTHAVWQSVRGADAVAERTGRDCAAIVCRVPEAGINPQYNSTSLNSSKTARAMQ